ATGVLQMRGFFALTIAASAKGWIVPQPSHSRNFHERLVLENGDIIDTNSLQVLTLVLAFFPMSYTQTLKSNAQHWQGC
ncbi:MAG: hypothetical protein ACSHXD_07295, partial [Marinosulfonomonas sp.]